MSASTSRTPYLIALVLVAALIAVAWIGRGRFSQATVGAPAPDFSVVTLDGEEVRLSDYQGKVVLLNIWATWCLPCREEMPSMQRLYEELEGTDFEILAVSIDAPLGQTGRLGGRGGDLQAFVDEYDLTFPVLHDREQKVYDLYQATGVPESIVVGRDGLVYRRLAGATVWDDPRWRDMILRLLGDGGPAAAGSS